MRINFARIDFEGADFVKIDLLVLNYRNLALFGNVGGERSPGNKVLLGPRY